MNRLEGQCGRCFGDQNEDGSCDYCGNLIPFGTRVHIIASGTRLSDKQGVVIGHVNGLFTVTVKAVDTVQNPMDYIYEIGYFNAHDLSVADVAGLNKRTVNTPDGLVIKEDE
jgi:hypothetical protein